MKKLYQQRHDFAVIGLTGRSGAGCSEVAGKLNDKEYIAGLEKCNDFKSRIDDLSDFDKEKINICLKYLSHDKNWQPFIVIKYTNVISYLMFLEAINKYQNEEVGLRSHLLKLICSCDGKEFKRFDNNHKELIGEVIKHSAKEFNEISTLKLDSLEELLSNGAEKNSAVDLYQDFENTAEVLSEFTRKLEKLCLVKTKLFYHDMAIQFRKKGCSLKKSGNVDEEKIFFLAQIINRLIKGIRKTKGHGRVVIDSIKNSLELSFFQSRYAAFYCIATNKIADERYKYKIKNNPGTVESELIKFDETEFKGTDVAKGHFSAPDVENCIQKSGYHIFYSNEFEKYSEILSCEKKVQVCVDVQLVKFLALLNHPGIITPTSIERNMQIAFTAKANSGCISRQVGAVVTDKFHSVKAVGWNDVAAGQMPCNLRNINDLVENKNTNYFSSFEKGRLPLGTYAEEGDFKQQVTNHLNNNINQENLQGRNCSFCFKTFHNVFEGKANQVHTRSLHAEENAMLQITKYGGHGIKDGKLYTTASPCELCSKKAFQLGIKTIFYIDPYPGIATNHILKSGKRKKNNPKLVMFQGAVGKAYHRLFDPMISYKDELNILIDLHPKMTPDRVINKLTTDKTKQEKIRMILDED